MARNTSTPERSRRNFDPADVLGRIRLLVDIKKHQEGWTQAEFARKVGIGAARLSHYLAGTYTPQIEAIARIADRLGVSTEWLIFGSGPMYKQDLAREGIGLTEATIALSSVLADIAKGIRLAVSPKATEDMAGGDAEELELDRAVRELFRSRVDAYLQAVS